MEYKLFIVVYYCDIKMQNRKKGRYLRRLDDLFSLFYFTLQCIKGFKITFGRRIYSLQHLKSTIRLYHRDGDG